MLKITIIALGHLKENYLRDAAKEYEKRLSGYCKLNIVEIEPQRLPDNPSEAEINTALNKEAEKINASIPQGSYVLPLCIEGASPDSVELSRKLSSIALDGFSNVCFIIGSSYGIANEIKTKSHYKLSMSKMTFPHQLARIMLLEQIYRAFKISSGGTYHK